jgi:hypothetical protein
MILSVDADVDLEQADEMAGGKCGIVEEVDHALGGEMGGFFLKPSDFFSGGLLGRFGILIAAPLENVGTIKSPDRHAGGFDTTLRAEISPLLPAVAGAGRRVVEKKEEFVQNGEGLSIGILGVLQLVQQRIEARDFKRRAAFGFGTGFGTSEGFFERHKAASLRRIEENPVSLRWLGGLR